MTTTKKNLEPKLGDAELELPDFLDRRHEDVRHGDDRQHEDARRDEPAGQELQNLQPSERMILAVNKPTPQAVERSTTDESKSMPAPELEAKPAPQAAAIPNPFDPASFRLDQSLAEGFGVKRVLTRVPIQKPGKQDWIRVNPDPTYRLEPVAIITMQDTRETYLVTPELVPELIEELTLVSLVTAITRAGDLFLWPLRIPDPNGGLGVSWHRSAMKCAESATQKWVRVVPKMSLGGYEAIEAPGKIPEPAWLFPRDKILEVAFGEHNVIRDINHDILRKLRGEI